MASKYPGSKVMVCTDGLANVGVGDVNVRSDIQKKRGLGCIY